jgi:hypothetical protein
MIVTYALRMSIFVLMSSILYYLTARYNSLDWEFHQQYLEEMNGLKAVQRNGLWLRPLRNQLDL